MTELVRVIIGFVSFLGVLAIIIRVLASVIDRLSKRMDALYQLQAKTQKDRVDALEKRVEDLEKKLQIAENEKLKLIAERIQMSSDLRDQRIKLEAMSTEQEKARVAYESLKTDFSKATELHAVEKATLQQRIETMREVFILLGQSIDKTSPETA